MYNIHIYYHHYLILHAIVKNDLMIVNFNTKFNKKNQIFI